jgi:Mn-dependent DtxR family transcriptional regulator
MSGKIQHTNENELTHSMVHYLLTIHKLKEKNGYARVTDIANDLALTKGSVSTAVNNLKKRELVEENESKFLTLSKLGHEEVHRILSSRTLLFYLLKDVVGVNQESAHKDSCLIEHLISEESREKLFIFMKESSQKNNLGLDLEKFDNLSEFEHAQRGDSYLKEI